MRLVAILHWALAGLLGLVGLLLLAQLSGRADQAARAAESAQLERENAAVIRTPASVTIQYDQLRRSDSLVSGWSAPESGAGVWSNARSATLRLPTPLADGDLDITIKAQPYLAPGLPAQRVVVRAGETVVATWTLTADGSGASHATLPRKARIRPDEVELHLQFPDADVPARRTPDAGDARLLGIKVRRIDLAAIQPAHP